jgi:hypothetical protein
MTPRQSGRLIGALFLVQFALGVLNMQVLTAPLFAGGGYLPGAAAHAEQIGVSVLLAFAGCCLSLAIAALAYPVFRSLSAPFALGFVLVSTFAAGLSALEQVGILAMREFSQAYVAAGPEAAAAFENLRAAGSMLRNGAHYVSLLAFGVTMGLWYAATLRLALLPAPLCALGLLAVALQLYSISLPVLGGEVSFLLLAPMGLAQLGLSLWLLACGFRGRD